MQPPTNLISSDLIPHKHLYILEFLFKYCTQRGTHLCTMPVYMYHFHHFGSQLLCLHFDSQNGGQLGWRVLSALLVVHEVNTSIKCYASLHLGLVFHLGPYSIMSCKGIAIKQFGLCFFFFTHWQQFWTHCYTWYKAHQLYTLFSVVMLPGSHWMLKTSQLSPFTQSQHFLPWRD